MNKKLFLVHCFLLCITLVRCNDVAAIRMRYKEAQTVFTTARLAVQISPAMLSTIQLYLPELEVSSRKLLLNNNLLSHCMNFSDKQSHQPFRSRSTQKIASIFFAKLQSNLAPGSKFEKAYRSLKQYIENTSKIQEAEYCQLLFTGIKEYYIDPTIARLRSENTLHTVKIFFSHALIYTFCTSLTFGLRALIKNVAIVPRQIYLGATIFESSLLLLLAKPLARIAVNLASVQGYTQLLELASEKTTLVSFLRNHENDYAHILQRGTMLLHDRIPCFKFTNPKWRQELLRFGISQAMIVLLQEFGIISRHSLWIPHMVYISVPRLLQLLKKKSKLGASGTFFRPR
jgi:hypothetical protein